MILLLFHDRRSLADVAGLKSAIEECYSPYGLRVQESGYLYVPLEGTRLNAAQLLKYLGRAFGTKKALWLVDSELFYPGIGAVLGCSAKSAALLYAGLEPDVLAKEALHDMLDPAQGWARDALSFHPTVTTLLWAMRGRLMSSWNILKSYWPEA